MSYIGYDADVTLMQTGGPKAPPTTHNDSRKS